MPLHESEILKPKDPSLTDDNEWPEFLLTNAEVYDAKTGDLVSLIHADEHAPVSVRGKLETPHVSQAHLLLKPGYQRTTSLEVTDVNRYSYGIYDDKEIAIWATGLAGHFKIQPSRAYRHIFKEMVQAIRALYFITDMHCGQAGKPKKRGEMAPSPQKIFSEYSREAFECANTEDAAKIIYKHRKFLFTCMVLGKENVNWKQTPFYIHMVEKFPTDFEAAQPPNRRRKRKRMARPKEDFTNPQQSGLSYVNVDMKDGNLASNVSRDSSQTPIPRRRGRPPKAGKPPTPAHTPLQQTKAIKSDIENSGEDSESIIDRRMAYKGKGKGKSTSALRPKTITDIPQRDASDEDNEVSESPLPILKRKNTDVLERQPPKRVQRNSAPPEFDEDEAIDMPFDNDDAETADGPALAPEANHKTELPLRWKSDTQAVEGSSRPPFMITTERMPSSEPQGPGDVWVCTYDGCLRKVYGASKEPGKGLVQEHLKMHSQEGEDRVELVRKEGELADGLPVRYECVALSEVQ